jgi:hypothetical protein
MALPVLIDALGTKWYIADPNGLATPPAASPNPWTLIGELASIGAIAFEANQERSTALTRVTDVVLKGVEPMPSVSITFNKLSAGDLGQQELFVAQKDRSQDQWYWFKMTCPDIPAGSPTHLPTTATFKGKVVGYTAFAAIGTTGVVQGGATVIIDHATWSEAIAV